MIEESRVKKLNEQERRADGKYVLYWMQQSQRSEYNHALDYAILQANELDLPLLVVFGITEDYPEANLRHYLFMLQGLKEVRENLAGKHIPFVLYKEDPPKAAEKLAGEAALVVCDRGYLRHQRAWRKTLAESLSCPVIQVESDLLIPVETTSGKQEYAARTIRSKIHRHLADYRHDYAGEKLNRKQKYSIDEGLDLSDPARLAGELKIDQSVGAVDFKGGSSRAVQRLRHWLDKDYTEYSENRNQPHLNVVSHMSMFLHFGQISPLWIMQEMKYRRGENFDAYLEELIVRRELAANYVYYSQDYDSYKGLPDWALETLKDHASDEREKVYTAEELENAQTDDPYWNAAMEIMKADGYLHNHMRMYWGKQIITYTNTPEYAFKVALYLNNKYFLDGRDMNSYTNISWLFGLHDRPWGERPVFGKVRSMTRKGLERKINTREFLRYAEKVSGRNFTDP